MTQRLMLGTAQWGLDYGVTNAAGRLSDAAIESIVNECRASGIEWLDTARAYGDAESRIGALAQGFHLQTKLVASGRTARELLADLEASLQALGRSRVDAVLIHDWPSLSDADRAAVGEAFSTMLESGCIAEVGISGYTDADLAVALESLPVLHVAQLPVNALDQRLDGSSVVGRFREAGGRVQARSVFLQGTLIESAGPFSDHPDVRRWMSSGHGLTAALQFVRSRDWVDDVVVGVTSREELSQILSAWRTEIPAGEWSRLASSDLDLIDPRRWPQRS